MIVRSDQNGRIASAMRYFLSFLLILVLLCSCIPAKKLEYIPPPPEDPYPAELIGHTFLREFYTKSKLGCTLPAPGGKMEKIIKGDASAYNLSPKMVVSYDAKEFELYGKKIPLFNTITDEKGFTFGRINIIFNDVQKVTLAEQSKSDAPFVISELRAGEVWLKASTLDQMPFSQADYIDRNFNPEYTFDPEKNMLLVGRDLYIGYKLQRSEDRKQRTDDRNLRF